MKIKECPDCKRDRGEIHLADIHPGMERVKCTYCSMSGPYMKTEEEAIKKWNDLYIIPVHPKEDEVPKGTRILFASEEAECWYGSDDPSSILKSWIDQKDIPKLPTEVKFFEIRWGGISKLVTEDQLAKIRDIANSVS